MTVMFIAHAVLYNSMDYTTLLLQAVLLGWIAQVRRHQKQNPVCKCKTLLVYNWTFGQSLSSNDNGQRRLVDRSRVHSPRARKPDSGCAVLSGSVKWVAIGMQCVKLLLKIAFEVTEDWRHMHQPWRVIRRSMNSYWFYLFVVYSGPELWHWEQSTN